MGIIAKAAPILSEENLIDIIPVAWELIMETDQELAASAGNIQLCRIDSFMYKYVVWPAVNVLELTFMILFKILWRLACTLLKYLSM